MKFNASHTRWRGDDIQNHIDFMYSDHYHHNINNTIKTDRFKYEQKLSVELVFFFGLSQCTVAISSITLNCLFTH